eukprot:TRINITY_DN13379_c0_g1_i1.p1 TRINITY_DN13379_c0_g1~~TRINITY_DN13379_c0_g1_i1.p1  ORF type:complete len:433 (+),score=23.35 TRINITY_DN13379_c0_g1_i1:98-1396(+)
MPSLYAAALVVTVSALGFCFLLHVSLRFLRPHLASSILAVPKRPQGKRKKPNASPEEPVVPPASDADRDSSPCSPKLSKRTKNRSERAPSPNEPPGPKPDREQKQPAKQPSKPPKAPKPSGASTSPPPSAPSAPPAKSSKRAPDAKTVAPKPAGKVKVPPPPPLAPVPPLDTPAQFPARANKKQRAVITQLRASLAAVRDLEQRLARGERLTGLQFERLRHRRELEDSLRDIERSLEQPPVAPPRPPAPTLQTNGNGSAPTPTPSIPRPAAPLAVRPVPARSQEALLPVWALPHPSTGPPTPRRPLRPRPDPKASHQAGPPSPEGRRWRPGPATSPPSLQGSVPRPCRWRSSQQLQRRSLHQNERPGGHHQPWPPCPPILSPQYRNLDAPSPDPVPAPSPLETDDDDGNEGDVDVADRTPSPPDRRSRERSS